MGENPGQPGLKIGELAKRLGINIRTLRYYEAIGLLPPPERTEGGYRRYTEEDERLLRFILKAKRVGFSLDEIRRIIQLGEHGSACGYVRETLARHIAQIDAQIAELQHVRAELAAAEAAWQEPGGAGSGQLCGLIERWPPSPQTTDKENEMTANKRNVEVFTAGCPVCDPVVELVRRVACESCDVTIHNVKDDPQAAERARALHVQRLPMVLVDGKPAGCCEIGPVTEAGLRAAGIGAG